MTTTAPARTTGPLRPLELLGADTLLDADERDIAATVRRFVETRLAPEVGNWFESATLPKELAKEFGALGVLGMHLDGYGCAGTNAVSYGLACLELEAGDSGFRSFVSVQGSLSMFSIHRYGSDEQKEHWLPRLASGDAIGCFGLTEPDFGSNPGGMRTRARRDGSDWILTGTKMWITNGNLADVATVWAQTDEGVRGFVVPTDTPGFTANPIHRKLSLRASVTSELVLDNVRLPASAELPLARGLGAPLSCLNEARFGIVFGALGAARNSLETALDYAASREVFDRPLAAYQLTQEKLADMTLELGKGFLLALHLGRLKDESGVTPEQISLGKLNNVREALAIARECRTILGASGITLEYSPLRHANNLESVLTYEGTSEMHLLSIGRALTGHAAFR
ncbi:acyl-CoA dehydrogenase family protein [Rhodococcus ruber]|uniref:acyl-CoA dehydrogenase family protein n=1 Tax=Rhodococcus TaxID=1827 RepID=UPI000E6B147A|nr:MULTISPECIES: acyl-CoA dehydrogenase family protein [Rhodococcus]MDX5312025.1 acyl-CoA dehydrogenase family protein [Rhodococcus sp. (in: high G+C Gram-positive bacteria)]RIK04913.1 MAG: acyl-CoA dehydrogenase [Acidobacteriota bacterium]AXY54834.1 acyl-CoA dehydrogenase [Rhodococcus ruber]MDX5454532.1 acyl-CoA dehydrogenase family protein [Rhodococcus sp. (in: high G+C Gram-positive bacteria)]NGP05008.1 acyl-CoA dehydrogenase [Rhodococcus sp. 14C212]